MASWKERRTKKIQFIGSFINILYFFLITDLLHNIKSDPLL